MAVNSNTYTRFRAMAIRRLALIENGGLGSPLILTQSGEEVYDPETSTVVKTETVYNTTGLRNQYSTFNIDGEMVKQDDVNFYLSPVSTTEDELGEVMSVDTPEPNPSDTIEFLDKTYSVVRTRPWNHAGILIGYKVQARVAN